MERNVIIFMSLIFLVAIGTLIFAARNTFSPQSPIIVSTTTPVATSTAASSTVELVAPPETSFTIQ